MPNTPAVLGAGASALAGGDSVDRETTSMWAEAVLSALGRRGARFPSISWTPLPDCRALAPPMSSCWPRLSSRPACSEGLDREVSRLLAVQTLLGLGPPARRDRRSPEALRALVTSPGGTTAAALRVLEAHGFRSAVLEAVAAAADRSRELGALEVT